jgi:hypothetical protein
MVDHLHIPHPDKRRQWLLVSMLAIGVIAAGCAIAALLVQRSDSEQAIRRANQRYDILFEQNAGLSDQNRTLSRQIDSLADSLAQQQTLSACRVGISKDVDLAVLEYLKQYGGLTVVPDVQAVAAQVQAAITARAKTEETCGS